MLHFYCLCKSYNIIIFLLLCFECDLTFKTKLVRVASDIVFFFIVENKSFCFRRSYSSNVSLFTFIVDFLYSTTQ